MNIDHEKSKRPAKNVSIKEILLAFFTNRIIWIAIIAFIALIAIWRFGEERTIINTTTYIQNVNIKGVSKHVLAEIDFPHVSKQHIEKRKWKIPKSFDFEIKCDVHVIYYTDFSIFQLDRNGNKINLRVSKLIPEVAGYKNFETVVRGDWWIFRHVVDKYVDNYVKNGELNKAILEEVSNGVNMIAAETIAKESFKGFAKRIIFPLVNIPRNEIKDEDITVTFTDVALKPTISFVPDIEYPKYSTKNER